MKTQRRNNSLLVKISFGLLIFAFVLINGIAVSAWQAMVKNGNESNAVQFVSLVRTKQMKYASEHSGNFASAFEELDEVKDLAEKLEGEKALFSEYIFTMKVEPSSSTKLSFFSVNADPQVSRIFSSEAICRYYFDSTLRAIKDTDENRQATADDSSI